MGFNKIKCLFNDTAMNATIVDGSTVICSSPRLNEQQQALDVQYLYANLRVTLNGHEANLESFKFLYYPELKITKITNSIGPISGGTKSILEGENFDHPHVSNLKVRYGAILMTPKLVNGALEVMSPQA